MRPSCDDGLQVLPPPFSLSFFFGRSTRRRMVFSWNQDRAFFTPGAPWRCSCGTRGMRRHCSVRRVFTRPHTARGAERTGMRLSRSRAGLYGRSESTTTCVSQQGSAVCARRQRISTRPSKFSSGAHTGDGSGGSTFHWVSRTFRTGSFFFAASIIPGGITALISARIFRHSRWAHGSDRRNEPLKRVAGTNGFFPSVVPHVHRDDYGTHDDDAYDGLVRILHDQFPLGADEIADI
jgi:hypothetical protein